MSKKRKLKSAGPSPQKQQAYEHSINETFNDSEDEFYAHRDKILVDEAPATKRRRKLEEREAELQSSDEEVFEDEAATEEDEVDADLLEDNTSSVSGDNVAGGQEQDEEEAEERFWGASRRDYYNADVIETEADALEEEAEARRLQQKQLKTMTEADFGFNESEWAAAAGVGDTGRPVVETLPPIQIPGNATDSELMAILRARYPEFEPLAADLVSLSPRLEGLKAEIEKRKLKKPSQSLLEPYPTLTKFRALSAYLAAIAVYMSVLSSTKDRLALPPAQLRDHPIMVSLLRCRQLWDSVVDLGEPGQVNTEVAAPAHAPTPAAVRPKTLKVPKREGAASRDRRANAELKGAAPLSSSKQKPRVDVGEDYQDLLPSKPQNKKKQKRPDIQDLMSQAARVNGDDNDSEFGDEAPLTHEEAAEKAKKRKSLRFYTSQITQKGNKRGAASREAGGDDDIPYKERIKDKQARLMREAEQRANKVVLEDDGGEDLDESTLAEQINGDSNDYYDEIVSKSQQKKADKKARAEAYAEAARQGANIHEEEQIGPDGKRKITYAIAKNKGLVPKRKKEVRNPRVKKKKRYEQKMKKLSSIRPVYKGGEGKGGYGGELTGIKTNIVKSVKL